MSLTAEEAIEILRSNPSDYSKPEHLANLRQLIAQLDVTGTGSKRQLYNGNIANKLSVYRTTIQKGE